MAINRAEQNWPEEEVRDVPATKVKISIIPYVRPGKLGGWVPMLRVRARGKITANLKAGGELVFYAHALQAANAAAIQERQYPVIIPIRFFLGE